MTDFIAWVLISLVSTFLTLKTGLRTRTQKTRHFCSELELELELEIQNIMNLNLKKVRQVQVQYLSNFNRKSKNAVALFFYSRSTFLNIL